MLTREGCTVEEPVPFDLGVPIAQSESTGSDRSCFARLSLPAIDMEPGRGAIKGKMVQTRTPPNVRFHVN